MICNQPWSNDSMHPCHATLCARGEALYSVYLSMLDQGYNGDFIKLHTYIMDRGGYSEPGSVCNCSVAWSLLDRFNIIHFDGEKSKLGFFQLCNECQRRVIVVQYNDADRPRAGYVVACDWVKHLKVRDASGKFSNVNYYTNTTSYLLFSYVNNH